MTSADVMSEADLLIAEFTRAAGLHSPPPQGFTPLDAAGAWSAPDAAVGTARSDGCAAAGPAEAVDAQFARDSPRPSAYSGTDAAATGAPAEALRVIDGDAAAGATPIPPDRPTDAGFPALVSPAFASMSFNGSALESPFDFDWGTDVPAHAVGDLPGSPSPSVRSFGGIWPPEPAVTGPAAPPGPLFGSVVVPHVCAPPTARGDPAEPWAHFLAPSEPPRVPGATRNASPEYYARLPGSKPPTGLRVETASLFGSVGPYFLGQSLSAPNSPLFCGSRDPAFHDASAPGSPATAVVTPGGSPLLRDSFSMAVGGLPLSSSLHPCPGPERGTAASKRKSPGPARSGKKTPGPKALASEGRKPHPCRVPGCPKAFKRPEHLKRHTRTVHWGERPFECPKCRKPFSRLDNMVTHAKLHEAKARKDEAASASAPSQRGAATVGEPAAAVRNVPAGNARHFAAPTAAAASEAAFLALRVPFGAPPPEFDSAALQATLVHLAFGDGDAI